MRHKIYIPGSFLLIGDPGIGKTFLAEAVGGQASREVSFFSVFACDYEDIGLGPRGIEDLFSQARVKQPSIVFIDQLDAIGQADGTQLLHPALKQLLKEIVKNNDNGSRILFIAATNEPKSLHEKLIGDTKLLKKIELQKPDEDGREEIFSSLMTEMVIEERDSVCARVASLTEGFTGGDLKGLSDYARRLAARKDHKVITWDDIREALQSIRSQITENK